jgi:hypothetical protein
MVLATVAGVVVLGTVWEVFVRAAGVREFILLPPSLLVTELADVRLMLIESCMVSVLYGV